MILSGLIQIIRILMDFFKKNGFFNNPAWGRHLGSQIAELGGQDTDWVGKNDKEV